MTLEEVVLGAFLRNNDVIDEYQIQRDIFTGGRKIVYDALLEVRDSLGDKADILTVTGHLERKGLLEMAGGAAYVSMLTNEFVDGHRLGIYVKQLREAALKRRIKRQLEELDVDALTGDELTGKLAEIAHGAAEHSGISYSRLGPHLANAIERMENRRDREPEINTGLRELDNLIDEFEQELVTIAARPSVGKTALALTIALHLASNNIPIGFSSLEMSGSAIAARLLSMRGKVPGSAIKSGMVAGKHYTTIGKASQELSDLPFYLDDTPNAYFERIRGTARQMKAREAIKALFIDYGGLVKTAARFNSRREQTESVVKGCKELARELGITVFLLAQINRHGEETRPTLKDLKETGAYEEDSDAVIMIHRDRYSESLDTELIMAKRRNGDTGIVKAAYLKNYTRFETLSHAPIEEGA